MTSSPPPPAPSSTVVPDVTARRLLMPVTLTFTAIGFAHGMVYSVQTGYPMRRAVARSAVNAFIIPFTFLATSLALSERSPTFLAPHLRSSTLANNALAGAVTIGVFAGVVQGAKGNLVDSRTAVTAGLRGAAAGVLVGTVWWGARSCWQWNWERRRVRRMQQRQRQLEAAAQQQSGEGGSPAVDDSTSSSWLPNWSPVRVATAAELARHQEEAERRRKKAEELMR